ncbi:MAG TPA: serine/threonine-protein kinase [Caulifigura sp.]|jgi:serine/threonine protein kinase|nr:serine/threonine-protein kinase [Caulifigura sp.]
MKQNCTCPPPEALEKLLAESAGDPAETDIIEHVGECSGCQQKLELMADSQSRIIELVAHIDRTVPSRESAYWPALQAAKELDQDPASQPTFVPGTTPAVPRGKESLDFLEPSDDPAFLGRLGHFDVTRLVGRGGMGYVFEAHDNYLHRTVALKVLDPQLANDDVSKQRFCREARAAAAITHDHVVPVYQVEKMSDGRLPFLVMQLIQGETLEKRLARDGKLPLVDILRIGLQTSAALAAAHSQGVIHRDLKPSNILLDSSSGRAKLTDFGLARCIEDLSLTRTGFVAGTPLYMSPEQALGTALDERSDLFSLGAVLYEMSTGRPPFRGATPLAVLKQITDRPASPARTLNADLPAWLNDLIQQLLSKRPDQRPVSAAVVAEELGKRLSAFEPVSPVQIPAVHTTGACETVMRQHRRSRWLAMIGGMALGAALMLGIGLAFKKGGTAPQATSNRPVGEAAFATLKGNAGPIWSVEFTPDGKKLVTGVENGTVKIWDLEKLQPESTLPVNEGPTWATSVSADGKLFATGHDDGSVLIVDFKSGETIRSFKAEGPVRSLKFAPQGTGLAIATRNGHLGIWDPETGERTTSFIGHKGMITHVTFSNDGKMLGSAGGDSSARIWNVATGREKTELTGHTAGVYGISFSADDSLVATGGWDRTVRVWDSSSGQPLGKLDGHTSDVWAVAFAPTGHLLASVGEDRDVRLWDARQLKELPLREGHSGTIYTMAFSKQGVLATAGRDGAVRLWNVSDIKAVP